jgi:hypothetical protein
MPGRGPRYTEEEARVAIAASLNFSEALRKLGMRPAGGNHATLRRYAEEVWDISTRHFDPHAAQRDALRQAERKAANRAFLPDLRGALLPADAAPAVLRSGVLEQANDRSAPRRPSASHPQGRTAPL